MKNPFVKRKNDYEGYDDSYDNDFYRGDEDEEDGVVGEYETEEPALPQKKVQHSAMTGNTLKVVKPRKFTDCGMIAQHLMNGYTVVMNVEELEPAVVKRLTDFIYGAIAVLGGDFRRVTSTTLVASPRSVEMTDGDEMDGADEDERY